MIVKTYHEVDYKKSTFFTAISFTIKPLNGIDIDTRGNSCIQLYIQRL